MAEKWQQWMPFHIDRFRGSPDVQAMAPAARIGFLYLLACAWQTDDCSISADPLDLATMSGLGDEAWATYGPRILRKFVLIDGRLRNEVLFEEWSEAKRVFDARSMAAKRTNSERSPRKKATVTERSPLRSADTITGTETRTKRQEESTREDEPTVEEIVCAHPTNVARGMSALQAPLGQCAAVVEVLASGVNRAELLAKTRAIAAVVAEWPPGERKFLKRVESFFREFEFNKPLEEWSYAGNQQNPVRGNRRVEQAVIELAKAGVSFAGGGAQGRTGQDGSAPGRSDRRDPPGLILTGAR
jgi:hypothetical protein